MNIQFEKYHGLGNDFVIINNMDDSISLSEDQIAFICDRHFGIGADGLIFARPSKTAEFFMDYYNSDGSIAEMCGNGIRCYAKYLHDSGLTTKETIDIETRAGILKIELVFGAAGNSGANTDGGAGGGASATSNVKNMSGENADSEVKIASGAKVDMGEPILEASKVPVVADTHSIKAAGEQLVDGKFTVDGETFHATCVSMGNPHCVTFVEDTANAPVLTLGPKVEISRYFPQKTNVEFARIISRGEIDLRVWERGCGETMACGTGACATLVAAVLNNKTDRSAVVHLPGGDLNIEWAENNHVIMQGPATHVFSGSIGI
jgi:diaminopimelate epimerase